jgi:hypothetical protein
MSTGWEQVGWMWTMSVSVVWVGVVDFQIVVRLTYKGFLWGNGVLGPLMGFRPVGTNLGGSGGGGYKVQCPNREFVGKLGWMVVVVVIPMVLVAG